ncbi:hypothetical protein C0J52_03893 [Blattella germanica]|nr:hypothetical protein C0J52_03893 [Blattella germanica]
MSQLREKKAALIKRYEDVKKILKNIHKEIDVPLRKFAPTTPKFDEVLEFPEKDTEITEEELQKFRRKKMAESEEKLERMLLRIVSEVEIQEDLLPDPTDTKPVDDEYEPLLAHIIIFLLISSSRKLHEQENILKEIEDKTLAFDKEVEELRDGKATAHMDSKILELHMLTLQQEVLILKDYEAIEDEVSNKVMTSLEEKHNLDEKVNIML